MSQKFDNNVLDLAKQKGFYPSEYMKGFNKFKEEVCSWWQRVSNPEPVSS